MKFIEGIEELISHFVDFFWGIGFYGWQISTCYALYISTFYSWSYSIIYALVFILFGWFNHIILKDYINDPRPADSIRFLASEHFNKRSNGMPSGHAQQTAFSLTLAYLLTGEAFYESWLLFGITVLQRYVYKNHTIPQLFAGGVLGLCLGYAVFYSFKYWERYRAKVEKKVNKFASEVTYTA